MSRTCIIISPYFPPSMLAGVHRARHLAKHLPAAGWTPVVLCVDEAYHEQRLDPCLARLVPDDAEIVKVPALSHGLTRPFGVGDIGLRGLLALRGKLHRLLETRSVGAVLITGSPYYPMLMASEVTKRFGTPVVLDFQDPWVSAWGASQPRFSKAWLSHSLARVLEPRALRGAAFITSVSEVQNAQLAARYPWLDSSRMAAIPIGFDPADFEALRTLGAGQTSVEIGSECFNLSYVGTIWPAVMPTLRVFLRALSRLRATAPGIYRRFRVSFVGTTANPNPSKDYRVLPLAELEGVADCIREVPQRLPYLEALSVVVNSDASLMIGSSEPHYSASKIYPYLTAGRPYLSIFHQASSAHEVLVGAGGGVALGFANPVDLAALEEPIAHALRRLAEDPGALAPADEVAVAQYLASTIARRYVAIFDRLQIAKTEVQ